MATPDYAAFQLETYEVLLRDCGFVECHGREGRFLQIVGPGRTRLSPDAPLFEATPEEVALSYRSARALIDKQDPESSDLLRKPLAPSAGGAGHKGVDVYGRDVYANTADPDYQVLRRFVTGVPGIVQPVGTGGVQP